MRYRAIIKKSDKWWIGWLVDLPGVNAQEKTKEKLIESLIIGAMDMIALEVPFEPDAIMTTIDIPEPKWIIEGKENKNRVSSSLAMGAGRTERTERTERK